MKKTILLSIFILFIQFSFAQGFGSAPPPNKYKAAKVVDPVYGITMYEKLNPKTGGDSVRNDRKGYACQEWVQDVYESGKVLHRGYYEDGQLKIYKNYYENGNVERSFKGVDFKRSSMQIYYPNGKLKSEITYYESNPQIWTDYYQNGQIEYSEENTKNMEYLITRKSFAEDGKPQEIFEVTDPKKKRYSKKEYYENGKIKAEGPMRYNAAVIDYQKDGVWTVYDESGTVTKEKWVKGEQIKN
jgi:antitoxin component YwqK of YwqJK toxin-antitoxin module